MSDSSASPAPLPPPPDIPPPLAPVPFWKSQGMGGVLFVLAIIVEGLNECTTLVPPVGKAHEIVHLVGFVLAGLGFGGIAWKRQAP